MDQNTCFLALMLGFISGTLVQKPLFSKLKSINLKKKEIQQNKEHTIEETSL